MAMSSPGMVVSRLCEVVASEPRTGSTRTYVVSVKNSRENRILSRVVRWLNKVLTVHFTVSVSSPTSQLAEGSATAEAVESDATSRRPSSSHQTLPTPLKPLLDSILVPERFSRRARALPRLVDAGGV
eukprot:29578-Prorocentrum_minimum.AAC.1